MGIIINGQKFIRCDTCNNFYPTLNFGCPICRDNKISKEIRSLLDTFKKRSDIMIFTIPNKFKNPRKKEDIGFWRGFFAKEVSKHINVNN